MAASKGIIFFVLSSVVQSSLKAYEYKMCVCVHPYIYIHTSIYSYIIVLSIFHIKSMGKKELINHI